jgi:phosphatidylglycerophosphatase A
MAGVSWIGLWAAGTASRHLQLKDPAAVVIDEISGQQIVFLGLAPLTWKYVLIGFLVFRVLDIWKPFPVRQAESWPGGWGIMADDWLAGLYAALILRLARFFGF